MNATEEMVRRYVEAFHATAQDLSCRFFPSDQAKKLLHNSLVPARIICYVSTQFGIALEYAVAPETTIETVRGSAGVEDLLVQAPRSLREVGPAIKIAARDIVISKG